MLPSKHRLWVTLKYNEKEYCITSPINDRSTYSLYEKLSEDKYQLLSTSNSPLKLEERVYTGKYD